MKPVMFHTTLYVESVQHVLLKYAHTSPYNLVTKLSLSQLPVAASSVLTAIHLSVNRRLKKLWMKFFFGKSTREVWIKLGTIGLMQLPCASNSSVAEVCTLLCAV